MAGRTVTIELGGKERHLKFDLNAVAEIGERLNVTVRLEKLAEDLLSTPLPLSALRVLLWAGLRHEDPELTPEQVGAWVDLDNIGEVWDRFFTLFGDKFSAKVGATVGQMLETSREASTSQDSNASPTGPLVSSPSNFGG